METHTLVADVGGTQSRLGLAQNGILNQASVQYFVNAQFHSFYEVIAAFLKQTSNLEIARCVIAIAGPILANTGKLTNLDWDISVDGLMRSTQCREATLINDLSALGYSLPALPSDGTKHIGGPNMPALSTGQFLVVGLGTGFNVCPVIGDPTGHPVCLQAELGHAALPHNVKSALSGACDDTAFTTVEDIFSGNGLSKLYQTIAGAPPKDGAQIVQDHLNASDPSATKTLGVFTQMLGLLTRELVVQYMPTSGIYFAGSVSRGIFEAGLSDRFNETVYGQDHFLSSLSDVPIRLITDDAAGLLGCSQRSEWI